MEIGNFTSLYSRPTGLGSINEWVHSNSVVDWQLIDDNVFIPNSGTLDNVKLGPESFPNLIQSWKFNSVNYENLSHNVKIHILGAFTAFNYISGGYPQGINSTYSPPYLTDIPIRIHWKLNNVWNSGELNVTYCNDFHVPSSTGLFRWYTFETNAQVPSGHFNDFEIGISEIYKANSLNSPFITQRIDAIYAEIIHGNALPLYINSSYPESTGAISLFAKNNTYNDSGLIPIHEQGHISLGEPMKLSVFDYGDGGYWPPVNSTIPPKFVYNYDTRRTNPIAVDVPGVSKYDNWSSIGTYGNGKSATRWANGNTDVYSMTVSPINSIIVPGDAILGLKKSYALFNVPRFAGSARNIKIKFTAVFYDSVTYRSEDTLYPAVPFGPHEKRGWVELVNYPKRSGVFSGDPFRTGGGDPFVYNGVQTSYRPYFNDIYGLVYEVPPIPEGQGQVPNLENYAAVNAWKEYTIDFSSLNEYEILWDDFINLQLAFWFDDINLSNTTDPTNVNSIPHAYVNSLGYGRIKSAELSFEVPTMPLYIEGGTWETITVPLFGYNDDGTSKSPIPLYTDGHGFPASGLFPIYVSGIPGVNLSVPMYAHNFASFESGIPIYTSGMYQSELYAPLYTISREPTNSSVPLYTNGITQSTLASPLYSLGPVPYSGALSMFSVGPRPLDSGLSLYTSGPTPINSGALLYTFNEFGERATQKGVNLYTQSAYFANSGISLYTNSVYKYDFLYESSLLIEQVINNIGSKTGVGFQYYTWMNNFAVSGILPTGIPYINEYNSVLYPNGSVTLGAVVWGDYYDPSQNKFKNFAIGPKQKLYIINDPITKKDVFEQYLELIDPYDLLNRQQVLEMAYSNYNTFLTKLRNSWKNNQLRYIDILTYPNGNFDINGDIEYQYPKPVKPLYYFKPGTTHNNPLVYYGNTFDIPALTDSILYDMTNAIDYAISGLLINKNIHPPFFNMYVKGLYYESSGKFPLYTKTSYDGTSNSFDSFGSTKLYIKQTGISGVRTSTLYIHNEGEVYSGGQARTLYVHSPQPIYSIDGSIGLTLKNSVSGVSLGAPLYTQYLRDISIFDPLYFELDDNAIPMGQGKTLMVYNNSVSQSIPLSIRVSEPKESGISVYLEGTNRANSGTPLSTLGIGNWAGSLSVYTHGF